MGQQTAAGTLALGPSTSRQWCCGGYVRNYRDLSLEVLVQDVPSAPVRIEEGAVHAHRLVPRRVHATAYMKQLWDISVWPNLQRGDPVQNPKPVGHSEKPVSHLQLDRKA